MASTTDWTLAAPDYDSVHWSRVLRSSVVVENNCDVMLLALVYGSIPLASLVFMDRT